MDKLNLAKMMNLGSAPYWLILVGTILVGVGLGLWVHLGAGISAAGVLLVAFGVLIGSD